MDERERTVSWFARIGIGAVLFGAGILMGRSSRLLPEIGAPVFGRADAGAAVAISTSSAVTAAPATRRAPRALATAEAMPLVGEVFVPDADLMVWQRPDKLSLAVGTIQEGSEVIVVEQGSADEGADAPQFVRVARPGEDALGWVMWTSERLRRSPKWAGQRRYGTATIRGAVRFTGRAPDMPVPRKRRDAEVCKERLISDNAVVIHGDRLQDVFVGLTGGARTWRPPEAPVIVEQTDCTYAPRIQGAVTGQRISFRNLDGTLHNVHAYLGTESWFNQAQPRGSLPIDKELPGDVRIVRVSCDVHPWMRAFVVVWENPFFATSRSDGSFVIERVPRGRHTLQAWHSRYGQKTLSVEVHDGSVTQVELSYDGTEPEPPENKGELDDL